MNAAPLLTIYILSRDRPEMFEQALLSVLAQEAVPVRVIVSDNSETNHVEKLMQACFPDVEYLRRAPPLAALAHFAAVFDECTSDFVTLFHDDDLMAPDYAATMIAELVARPKAVAIGCDAKIIVGTTPTDRTFMDHPHSLREIADPEALVVPYLLLGHNYPAPFPGYMYRRAAVGDLRLDKADGGKYADVAFLLKLMAHGPLVWLPKPLMQYRFHAGNDSRAVDPAQQLRLLRFIRRTTTAGHDARFLREFRVIMYVRAIFGMGRHSRRRRVATRYLLTGLPVVAFTSAGLWRRAFAVAWRKLTNNISRDAT